MFTAITESRLENILNDAHRAEPNQTLDVTDDADNEIKKLNDSEMFNVTEKMKKARIKITYQFPFFGILLFHLKIVYTYELINTMATDGNVLLVNPNFVNRLSDGELMFVLSHEVMHCSLKHIWRCGTRNRKYWNEAVDYVVNGIIKTFIDSANTNNNNQQYKHDMIVPTWTLINSEFTGLSAEDVYDKIANNQYTAQVNGDDNNDNFNELNGEHDLWAIAENAESNNIDASNWDEITISAAESSANHAAGAAGAFLNRLINRITKPQKNWRQLLNEFIIPEINDYSFSPPDRRYTYEDIFLPDFNDVEESVKNILFFIDTSGSVSDDELGIYYSEICGAVQQFGGKLCGWIGFFDHEVYEPTEFNSAISIVDIKPKGGGGTSFFAPFEYVADKFKDKDVAGIVMLTDGWATWPEESIANHIPVLWLITNEQKVPPWGLHTTIRF